MYKKREREWTLLRESIEISIEVMDEFGEDVVKKARQRLCTRCSEKDCPLLPLCLDGSDCPYFKLKEVND
jgi:hypothetical protein